MVRKVMGYKLWVISLVIFLSFLQAGCYAQQIENINIADKEKSEKTDPYTWDFGQVKEGELLKHNFALKNESQKVINIKDVNTSCGCTVSKVAKKTLLPGEATSIEVQFNSKGYSGSTQHYIYVHTDNLDTSTSLSINGESKRTIDNPIIRFIIKAEVVK